MKKLTKKLLITTSTILGLLTIGVGTSVALSSCAKKELKLENFIEWPTKVKINILTEFKTTLNNKELFAVKSLNELINLKKEELIDYNENVSNKLFKWLNTNNDKLFNYLIDKKTNLNKLIMELFHNDLKEKVVNKDQLQKDFTKKVEPLIKDINYPINNGFMSDVTLEVRDNLNKLIDLYINLYKSL